MDSQQSIALLESIVGRLELPDTAYEKAKIRYDDIGEWFNREESQFKNNKPYVFPQGSFRIGTAIYPIDKTEPYDLDLACNLKEGINKSLHTQQFVKTQMGMEIEAYRLTTGIKAPKEEKHRCWRLNYADELSFHIDIVPCIPADALKGDAIFKSMISIGESEYIAGNTSGLTVSITDNRHPQYSQICDGWFISNPEGYAKWFESRMKQAEGYLKERVSLFKAANIDELPSFKWKTPLQRCVQVLKRHRDQMFKNKSESKPISVIITTLAARAYEGEVNINEALQNILFKMDDFINDSFPRIPNPVNPAGEDFAEKWARNQQLESNFRSWLIQARSDFKQIGDSFNAEHVTKLVRQKLNISLNEADLHERLGLNGQSTTGPIIINSKPVGRFHV